MVYKALSWFVPGLLLFPFCQIALSFELQPIVSNSVATGRHATRDDDFSVLDLLSSETFLWGGMCRRRILAFRNINFAENVFAQDPKMADPRWAT